MRWLIAIALLVSGAAHGAYTERYVVRGGAGGGAIIGAIATWLSRFTAFKIDPTKVRRSAPRDDGGYAMANVLLFLVMIFCASIVLTSCAHNGEHIREKTFYPDGNVESELRVDRETNAKFFADHAEGAGRWSYTASDGQGNEFEMKAGGEVSNQQAGDEQVVIGGIAELIRIVAPFLVTGSTESGEPSISSESLGPLLEQIFEGAGDGDIGSGGILDILLESDDPAGLLETLLGLSGIKTIE